jgi:CheY-like chemotaxis protein
MPHRVPILIITDNQVVEKQITALLEESPWPTATQVLRDSATAFAFLFADDVASTSRPALILLSCDFGPDGTHSQRFLRTLRSRVHLRDIPVVAFASGTEEPMALVFYSLYANARLAPDQRKLPDVVSRTCRHWLQKRRVPQASLSWPTRGSLP